MTNQTEASEQNLNRLLSEGAAVAQSYKSPEFRVEHLLFVISGTEEGRRVIESMGGNPRKIRRFLENTLEYTSGGKGGAVPEQPSISETIQKVIHDPIVISRSKGEPITLRAILRQMLKLGDTCQVTREALRSGGLLERSSNTRADDYRIPEEVEEDEDGQGSGAEVSSEDNRFVGPDADAPGAPAAHMESIDPEDEDDPEVDDTRIDEFLGRDKGPDDAGSEDEGSRLSDEVRQQIQKKAAENAETEQDEHHKAVIAAIRNLTSLASRGKLDDVIGREAVISRVVDTLCRRTKANSILVGEPGVGKTAIAEGLAQHLMTEEAPAALRGRPVLEVSMSDLVAGARFRGDFEARMRKLMDIAERERAILFMDEFHTVVGAGSTSGRGGMDASNILKPALARSDVRVIGATTSTEMREVRKDRALMRRFQVEQVGEPSAAETRAMIELGVASYTLHHEVLVDDSILDEIVSFGERYLPQRSFPDKAFDLIDMTCVVARRDGESRASMEHLRQAVARLGGPALGRPDPERAARVKALEEVLKSKVFGQHEAAGVLARAARISLLGLQPGGVAGSYLFNGPTGVGKTEMAQAFAAAMGLPLVAISMSEFLEKHSVARLIGAPPGYVGFDEEGLLTAAGDSYPEFVLLLDEVEKAHPDIFDIVLQVLDKGIVRAGDGRVVSLRGAHVIMTANIGASESEKASLGFGRQTNADEAVEEAKSRLFRKEFRARIQKEIQFSRIDDAVLSQIACAEFARISSRMADSAITVDIDAVLAAHMVSAVKDEPFASRSLQVRIKEDISDRIAEYILEEGGADRISVSLAEDEIVVTSD